ncbi:MAG TPA: hypothetical protein VE956_02795 [Nodularia sp. (in: cyanobacteria)]|nr:hypothetical protein [Nodularia sp. (in: cyanobacteria)]
MRPFIGSAEAHSQSHRSPAGVTEVLLQNDRSAFAPHHCMKYARTEGSEASPER